MAKKKVTAIVEELLADFLAEEGLELYHCEFAKEGGDWFLKVFIDYAPEDTTPAAEDTTPAAEAGAAEADAAQAEETAPRYIGTDECEKVSRYLSEQLDSSDPIEQNYYLMVSSPGMDRPLLKPSHWRRYVGEKIEIRLYRGKDGTKNITGTLDAYEEPGKANENEGKANENEGNANETAGTAQARITVTDEKGKVWTLEESEIAKANLAVVF